VIATRPGCGYQRVVHLGEAMITLTKRARRMPLSRLLRSWKQSGLKCMAHTGCDVDDDQKGLPSLGEASDE